MQQHVIKPTTMTSIIQLAGAGKPSIQLPKKEKDRGGRSRSADVGSTLVCPSAPFRMPWGMGGVVVPRPSKEVWYAGSSPSYIFNDFEVIGGARIGGAI